MKAKQQELISAFIDKELSVDELDSLLESMRDDTSTTQDILRFQRYSDVMQGVQATHNSDSLYQNLTDALQDEPEHRVKTTAKIIAFPKRKWKQAVGGLAVAASVALIVTNVGVNDQVARPGLTTVQPLADASDVIDKPQASPSTMLKASDRWTVGKSDVAESANSNSPYVNPYPSTTGLFPYGRVVAYDQQ